MLGLRGVVHVVGGPDVLHGRVLAALLRPEGRGGKGREGEEKKGYSYTEHVAS